MITSIYSFLDYLRTIKSASSHTLRNYCLDLNGLKNFLEKCGNLPSSPPLKLTLDNRRVSPLPLSLFTKEHVRIYVAKLIENGKSKRTIKRCLSSIKSFGHYCVLQRILTENPAETIQGPRLPKELPSPMTYNQVEILMATPDISKYHGLRDRCLMELFYSSGLRISEIVAINKWDLDFTTHLVRIKGKGKKERIVPITPHAIQWVHTYLNHPDRAPLERDRQALFLNRFGTRISTRSIDRKFQEYLRSSGLSGHITPHTIRHTIATHWLESGMDLKTIQMLLGHSSLETTTVYTQVSIKLKKRTYQEAHPHA
ncbi:Tyrosine recombinase XerC,site-specific tyrosine recombinase XerC,Site-specific recombinase XerD,tyrosine recombinase XerC,Phage integrase family [Chlamydia serpentis]|uniref:Tyrosine recombinase XerC n=1 Tax=Chlamydia serpentis TaxID=1967782 RepID=A0A2R8F9W2_9CHLA|nr:tyrosine recombinase XerC [Chlamydia serpentis]SPN73204.1 Tyrosine recombinase XerC,site-specific tyrosine recombinase XerC,Site-specific recombinase XerD,tyrosine recombinase XerC,Phage integrase family [Chlamydia serpentis]